jgi:hypothetical protein
VVATPPGNIRGYFDKAFLLLKVKCIDDGKVVVYRHREEVEEESWKMNNLGCAIVKLGKDTKRQGPAVSDI